MNKIKLFSSLVLVATVAALTSGSFFGSAPIADAAPPVGWVDNGTEVVLQDIGDFVGVGTTSPGTQKLGVVGTGLFKGFLTVEDHIKTGDLIATGTLNVAGDIFVGGLVDGVDISASSTDWNTAFTERNQWDGGSTNLDSATGRASLELGSLATASSVTNTEMATGTFSKIEGVGTLEHLIVEDSDGPNCHKMTFSSNGDLGASAVDCATGEAIGTISDDFDGYSGDLTGENGGDGWNGDWALEDTDSFDVVTTGCFSGDCIMGSGAAVMGNERDFASSANNGVITFKTKTHIGTAVDQSMRFRVAGDASAFVVQTRSLPAVVIRLSGATIENLIASSITDDVWYVVEVEFGDTGGSGACDANEVRARAYLESGGPSDPWTGCVDYSNNGLLEDVHVQYSDNTNTEYWIDDLILTR